MRKKSKYVPKPVYTDPMAYVKQSVATLSSHKALVNLQLKNHSALLALTQGKATKGEMDVVIAALNMAEAFCLHGHGSDYKPEVLDGLSALRDVCVRGAKTNHFVLRSAEMQAINLAMDVHNAQLEIVSLKDMEKAHKLVIDTIKAKKARVITHDDTAEAS